MSSNAPAIAFARLGKRYPLSAISAPPPTLRELVSPGALLARLRHRGTPAAAGDGFWALRELSLEIGRGESLGILGGNGAGKSTLLKILGRITEPTTGSATIRGRAACMLEVGTGFHPELTGRENIYLNGTILGMRRREIDAKFKLIVDFAEIGQFLDLPIKRYSSGMFVRLAFAVAVHLDHDILIMDEVLAVGDLAFRGKCMERIRSQLAGGTTVIFVSHDLEAVQTLCSRCLILAGGRQDFVGATAEAVRRYRAGAPAAP